MATPRVPASATLTCAVCKRVVRRTRAQQKTCLLWACQQDYGARLRARWAEQRAGVSRPRASRRVGPDTFVDAVPVPAPPPLPPDDPPREVRLPDGTLAWVTWCGDMRRYGERGGMLEPRASAPCLLDDEAPGYVGMPTPTEQKIQQNQKRAARRRSHAA